MYIYIYDKCMYIYIYIPWRDPQDTRTSTPGALAFCVLPIVWSKRQQGFLAFQTFRIFDSLGEPDT